MRTRSWESEIPSDQIPDNCPQQRAHEDVQPQVGTNQIHANTIADRFRDSSSEDSEGYEVKEGRPKNSQTWRQNSRGNHRGNGVCCIVETVDVVKNECQPDENHDEGKGCSHGESNETDQF